MEENGKIKEIHLNIWLASSEKVHTPLIDTYLRMGKEIFIIEKEGKTI